MLMFVCLCVRVSLRISVNVSKYLDVICPDLGLPYSVLLVHAMYE